MHYEDNGREVVSHKPTGNGPKNHINTNLKYDGQNKVDLKIVSIIQITCLTSVLLKTNSYIINGSIT